MERQFLNLIFSILIFTYSSLVISSDVIIISDMDDTIKQTNVDSTIRGGINAFFTRKVFPGMPTLLRDLESETQGLYILSNSPVIFRPNMKALLRKFGIEAVELSTRRLRGDSDKFKYKYNFIKKKLQETAARLILIGDDVGEDPEVYEQVSKDFPGRVLSIYVHNVNNRDIPTGQRRYISFLDIAIMEYEQNRLNLSQLLKLENKFTSLERFNSLFPKFKHCPTSAWRGFNPESSEVKDIVENMINRVIKFCKNR